MTSPAAFLALAATVAPPQDVPAPPVELSAPTAQAATAQPSTAQPSTDVEQLTLEQAVETALRNDLTLAQQEIASEIASFSFQGSWGSFDPVVSAHANYIREQDYPVALSSSTVFTVEGETYDLGGGLSLPITSGGSFDFSYSHVDNWDPSGVPSVTFRDSVAVSFSQPLLRGGGSSYATSNQTELDLRAKEENERSRQTRQDLIQRVVNAYWDLNASIDQLAVATETLALGREQLQQNERRLAAGVGTEVEVLQAQANVAQRIEQRLLRDTAVKGAADRLKAILYPGVEVETWEREIQPVTPLPEADAALIPDWQGSLLIALEQRSELRQQRFAIDATEQQLVRSKSERKPLLDFVAAASGYGFDGDASQAFEDAIGFEGKRYFAGLNFSAPIGNRAARYAELSARAALRSARITYDQLESQIVAEVRDATRNASYSAEAVRAAEVTRDLARRQLAAEQARYREGLSTNYQVLEFQQKLAEALYSYTLARANFAKAMTTLYRAQGLIGERKR